MVKFFELMGLAAGIVALVLLISLLVSVPVWLLWNGCLVGAVDGVHEVTWLQAWGISVLFSMLFKTSATKKD